MQTRNIEKVEPIEDLEKILGERVQLIDSMSSLLSFLNHMCCVVDRLGQTILLLLFLIYHDITLPNLVFC